MLHIGDANPDLLIDGGHGGHDSGAVGNGHKEKDLTLQVSLYQFKRAKELGLKVGLTRDTDKTLEPNDRAKVVRESNAKVCISNHFNAGGGDGGEVIHSIHSDGKLAQLIAGELKQEGQNIRRVFTRTGSNVRKDYYYMHRETGAVEVDIVEYAFIDNAVDLNPVLADLEGHAEQVLEAVCIYLKKPYSAPNTKKPEPVVTKPVVTKPQPVTPSKPVQTAPKKEYVHFPPNHGTWSVYPLNKKPVKANATGAINPTKFNGLDYQVLGHPYPDVVTIQTTNFGKVNIYVGDPNSKLYTK